MWLEDCRTRNESNQSTVQCAIICACKRVEHYSTSPFGVFQLEANMLFHAMKATADSTGLEWGQHCFNCCIPPSLSPQLSIPDIHLLAIVCSRPGTRLWSHGRSDLFQPLSGNSLEKGSRFVCMMCRRALFRRCYRPACGKSPRMDLRPVPQSHSRHNRTRAGGDGRPNGASGPRRGCPLPSHVHGDKLSPMQSWAVALNES